MELLGNFVDNIKIIVFLGIKYKLLLNMQNKVFLQIK